MGGAGVARGAGRLLPGIGVARRYRRTWLRDDIVAGLVLTALLVPQGIAYAELAGLPPVTGLYATMIPLAAYALFGPSRILVVGPDSAVAPLVAATVVPLAAADPESRVPLAAAMAVMVGVICMAGGIARFGSVTELLSAPVRVGYLAGIALTVIATQVPELAGIPADGSRVLPVVRDTLGAIGDADPTVLAVGAPVLAGILVLRRHLRRVPAVLVAVAGATIATVLLDLDVPVVGPMPAGIPAPAIPSVDVADLGALAAGALGIALVAYADTSILSRSYAARLGDRVDQDQELFALGAVNTASGLFGGFPLSSSSSRTPVAESAGSRTQLTGVVAAVAIGVLLVAAPSVTSDIPGAALAAVVVAAVLGLVDLAWFRRAWRVRRAEFLLAAASAAGVVVLGVLWGVAVAVGLSLLAFLRRAWRPHDAVLGRVDGLKGYHDVSRYPGAARVPGLLLFRFDAPLWFANAEAFRLRVLGLVDGADPPVRTVVVAAEPITDVDLTAADVLRKLHGDLLRREVALVFAELKDPVKDRVRAYGLVDLLGEDAFHPTLGVAVRRYVEDHHVDWTDWEDARDGRAGGP